MSSAFDPYHKWLGISPREQPPNHYRLLAIDLYESDPEVVDSAANRQMSYLQELASGPNVRHAQKLLNEIAAARVCLLDDEQRTLYDAKLKQQNDVDRAEDDEPARKTSRPQVGTAARPKDSRSAASKLRTAKPVADKPVSSAAAVIVDPRGTSEPHRHTTHQTPGRKNNKQATIVASAILLGIVVLGGIALALTLGGGSDDALAKGGDNNKASTTADAGRATTRAGHEQVVEPGDEDTVQSSEIPEPGADLNPDPAEPNETENPPVAEKPIVEQPAPEAGPPPLLRQAYEVLAAKNIPGVIAKLEEYLAGEPKPPYKEEAENLLAEAKTATSQDAIAKSLEAWLAKQTDEEVQQIANTNQVRLNISDYPIPVKNPVLKQVFLNGTGQFIQKNDGGWPELVLARLDPKKPDQVATKPDTPDPAAENPDDNEPAEGGGKEPDAALPRPSEPAALLAAEGLKKNGTRWELTDEEQALKEQVTQVSAAYKKVTNARKAFSEKSRQEVEFAKRQLKQQQAFIEKIKPKPGSVITTDELKSFRKKEAQVLAFKEKVDAAAGKILEADAAADTAAQELRPVLEELDKKVAFVEETYERLRNDDEVIAAMEAQGGTIAASPKVVKTAKSIATRARKGIGD